VSIRCTVKSGVVREAVGAWTKSPRFTSRRATTPSKGATICESISGERLVVHAPVRAKEIRHVTNAWAADDERVEDAHLDIRVRIERGECRIHPRVAVVIDEEAHADSAISGGVKGFDEQRSRPVVAPDIILHIQRPLGGVRQPHARCERIRPVAKRIYPANARVRVNERNDRFTQSRAGGVE
jgi:hypothetical protein